MQACYECGQPAVHEHHVVPKSKGGTKTVPLCLECHSKVHGRQLTHVELTRAGIQRAIEKGVKLGRKVVGEGNGKLIKVTQEQEECVRRLKTEGTEIARIARTVGLSRPTIYAILKRGEGRCMHDADFHRIH